MKAILEFNLDDFDDREAHLRAVKSLDLALALWDIEQMLRGFYKHTPENMDYDTIETIRKQFYEIMESKGINLHELMS